MSIDSRMIQDKTLIYTAKKTKKPKRLPLSPSALVCVQIARRISGTEGKLFYQGDLTHYNNALRIWAKKARIQKRLSSHVGRHSFATNLLLKGIPINVVQELLDHSKLETTAQYLHITKALTDKAVNLLTVNINKAS